METHPQPPKNYIVYDFATGEILKQIFCLPAVIGFNRDEFPIIEGFADPRSQKIINYEIVSKTAGEVAAFDARFTPVSQNTELDYPALLSRISALENELATLKKGSAK